MNIDKVLYNSKNKPYIPRDNGKKKRRDYGEVRKCRECGKDFFACMHHVKAGHGHFCSPLCSNKHHPEKHNKRWKGGVKHDDDGYIRILIPSHPNADCQGYICEHRIVIESRIKRVLAKEEVVHHINGIKNDNRIENLMLLKNHAEHRRFHLKEKTHMEA